MLIEEAAKKYFEEKMTRFEKDTEKVFTDPEDRKALTDMIKEWRRLGPNILQKLSMN